MVHEVAGASHGGHRNPCRIELSSMRAPAALVLLGALALTGALTLAAHTIGFRPLTAREPIVPEVSAREAPPPDSFIAFARDFREFREWERHGVEGAMMPIGAAEGPTFIYLNRRAPEGSQRWPVGTIVVKAIESGEPDAWTIHAMAKRGVPFNRDGAVGWEYFELRLPRGSDDPTIVWRGEGPPSGHGYAAMGRASDAGAIPLVCDDCHAAGWQNDSVLTPAISLR